MVAPSTSALWATVPYSGPSAVLGDVVDRGSPTYISGQCPVVIPDVLVGNEWKVGFAAFKDDNETFNRGVSTYTLANFWGFFENIESQEGNPGTNPWQATFGGTLLVPVARSASIYVYNSTAISAAISSGLSVVTSVTTGTTPAAILVGAVIQGATPAGATVVDVSSKCSVLTANTTVGGFVQIRVNRP